MWPLIFLFLPVVVHSQTPPPFIPEARPPPIQETDYVQEIIDDLLDGKTPQLLQTNKPNANSKGGSQRHLDPWSHVNASDYWYTDDLEPEGSIKDTNSAQEWLAGYTSEAQVLLQLATEAGWNYFTNITDYNRQVLVDSENVLGQYLSSTAKQAKQFDLSAFSDNSTLQRLLHMLSVEGMNALAEEQLLELNSRKAILAQLFTNAAVCQQGRRPPCTLHFRDLQSIMASSRHPGELLYMWLYWRKAVGKDMITHYKAIVRLSNIGANLNGFEDAGVLWRSPYELTAPHLAKGPQIKLEETLDKLYQQISPLYTQLHAYVRRRLASIFRPTDVPELTQGGPIPAHLLGSLNSDNWLSLYAATEPFPEKVVTSLDPFSGVAPPPWAPFGGFDDDPLTNDLQKKNYTALKLFKTAEKFFLDMGFEGLPEKFWNQSIFSRPWDRDMLCFPWTAFDLRDGKDYRVKACAEHMSKTNFVEAHRLLAQTYYQYAYRSQPLPFRESANPSFAAALADAIALASENGNYLQKLRLSGKKANQEKLINRLYKEALEHVVAMPFQIVIDLWRWRVFDGQYKLADSNQGWWQLTEKYQGLMSAVDPAEDKDRFDAMATPLVAQHHSPATRHMITYVLQYQMHKALCDAAGHDGPLDVHECDLSSSSVAGQKLKSMMSLGSSVDWPDALKIITNSKNLDAQAIVEYYQPLMDWLEVENRRLGVYVGWDGERKPFEDDVYAGAEGEPEPEGNALDNAFSRNAVAFAGEDCSDGRTCLQESECNGTVCICPSHLTQYGKHCLPDSGVNHGGHEFTLNIQKVEPDPETIVERPRRRNNAQTQATSTSLLCLMSALYVFVMMFR